MDYKKFGLRIREERLKLHLTQAQLAEAIDISDTYMGAIERGERCVTLDTLVRIAEKLEVTIDYLLADSVKDNDSNIIEQFRQITNGQPLERKQMAIGILRALFSYFEKDEA
jgi:transcriptional regulator with XRE-family HTH domain